MSLFEVAQYDDLSVVSAFFWSLFTYIILDFFLQQVYSLFYGILYPPNKKNPLDSKGSLDQDEVILPLPSAIGIVFIQALAGKIFGKSPFKSRYLTPIVGFREIFNFHA